MSYLVDHWSFDPFVIVVAFLVAWHEIGLARLARRSRPERTRQRRWRSLYFYAGLATLLITVCSPIDYWSDSYFFVHMVQHLLLMFAAPSLVVAGAPWQPLLDALPGRAGRTATGAVLRDGWARPLRAVAGFLLRPWVSVTLFSAVMVTWHLPVLLDFGQREQWAHIWLMHGSFFLAGVLFWLQFIPSPPFHRRMPLVSAGGRADRDQPGHVDAGHVDEHLLPGPLVPGLPARAGRDPAAVRGPGTRRGDPVGMR